MATNSRNRHCVAQLATRKKLLNFQNDFEISARDA
jgi:hypothetical protein